MRIRGRFKDILEHLGPGFITGAADDDPSGITTYSIAGAQYGYRMNWLSLFLIPLMTSIQEMCGRIGMVSGTGLAGVIRRYYSKRLLYFTIILLFTANAINIGADLGIMAASLQMILGLPFILWLILVTVVSVTLQVMIPYSTYSKYLKWLAFTLFAYVITAFLSPQDWGQIFLDTIIPHIVLDKAFLMTMVGFLGTTISPYLFFWQASEQVEEEIKKGEIHDFDQSPNTTPHKIFHMRLDTGSGMVFSNMISFFIIVTTASTLHAHGIVDIETPQQVALALRPLAGDLSYLLFAVGTIGIGLQAVPVLAGSTAYAFAESFGFKEGLAKKLTEAKVFYGIIGVATFVGACVNLLGINPIKALYYSAILNGIVAVPLLVIIIKLADDDRIVGKFKTPKWSRRFGWLTFVLMGISAIAMILYLLKG